MARVTGPLHSDTASGTFAKSLTFSKWKGRPYVRERVVPSNPKSAKQTGVRSMMGFLARVWKAKALPKWTGWSDAALAGGFSTFNAYVQENLARWQTFNAPTEIYPAAEASTGLTLTTLTTTGGVGQTNISITPSGATSIWGFAILRDTAEITVPDWTKVIGVIEADGANAVSFVDTPLDAGTYHYRAVAFNIDGKMGTVKTDQTATVS